MKRFKNAESMMRYYGKTDGPYEEEYTNREIHVNKSPHEIYQEYNRGYPDIGWFIPAGFFETMEEYTIRSEGIKKLVQGLQFYDIKQIMIKYWIPRTNFRSFQQWSANQMLPRMNYLCPSKIANNKNKRDFMVGWLIDIGWDPNHDWICLPPEDPYDDIKYVTNGIWDILNHKTYPMIKNEYYRLFHNNSHRYVQFVDMVDKSIPRNSDEMATFLITREKVMISHLVWLAKTDVRVYDYFKDRIFKKINHEIALSMAINDPLMTEEERLKRDLMLMTAPVRNEYLTRNEGHNRIRDTIVGEHVPPQDYNEAKNDLLNFYFRKDNSYMENYLLQRYAYYLDHPDKAKDAIDHLADLPYKVSISINEKYGKFNYEIIASICDAAITCYTKSMKKPRWSKNDAINHTLELLRDIYPTVIRVQGRVDPTGYEKVVNDTDMNIIGAIRVIMSNDDAKEAYAKMARQFGSQDPRHNEKIVELMTEIATDTINQMQVREKFNIKNPQHVLLRKEQPRNPRNMVTNFFDYHNDTKDRFCSNDTFDVVTNKNDIDGHNMSKIVTSEDERRINREREMKSLKNRNRVMNKYHVDHLGDAMERYLPDLEAHKLNYVGNRDRDIFKSNITERRRKLDQRELEEMIDKYDLNPYVDNDDEGIDLSDATPDELLSVIQETFTNVGKKYIRDLLLTFDLDAKSEYDEIDSDRMIKDRNETLRSNVEEIIDSGDPIYIKNGLGEKGTFVPEDVKMNKEKMIDMIEWMTTSELEEFINSYVDEESQIAINKMIKRGYTVDDVRNLLINNAASLAKTYDEFYEDDEYDIDDLSEKVRDIIDNLTKRDLVEIIQNSLLKDDSKRFLSLIDAGMHLSDIRNRLHHLLIDEYDPEYIVDMFDIDNVSDDEPESVPAQSKNDVYDRFDTVINSGKTLYSFMQYFMDDSEFESIIRTLDSAGGTLIDAKEVAWDMISKRYSIQEISDALDQYEYPDGIDSDDDEEVDEDVEIFLDALKNQLKDLSREELINFIDTYFDSDDARYLMKYRRDPNLCTRVFKHLINNYDINDILETFGYTDDTMLSYGEDDEYYDEEEEETDEDDGRLHFNWNTFQDNNDTLRDALIKKVGTTDQSKLKLEQDKKDFYQWMMDNDIHLNMPDNELRRTISRMNSLDFRKFMESVEKIARTGNRRQSHINRRISDGADLGGYSNIVNRMSHINVSSVEEEEETDEEAERLFRRALNAR